MSLANVYEQQQGKLGYLPHFEALFLSLASGQAWGYAIRVHISHCQDM
jgi:hypothetical protein